MNYYNWKWCLVSEYKLPYFHLVINEQQTTTRRTTILLGQIEFDEDDEWTNPNWLTQRIARYFRVRGGPPYNLLPSRKYGKLLKEVCKTWRTTVWCWVWVWVSPCDERNRDELRLICWGADERFWSVIWGVIRNALVERTVKNNKQQTTTSAPSTIEE